MPFSPALDVDAASGCRVAGRGSYPAAAVSSRLFTCREQTAGPYRAVETSPPQSVRPARYPIETTLREADGLALALRAALARLTLPLARAAAVLVRRQAWSQFGFARAGDYARERLGRSSRWLRDLAALGEALQALPSMASALTGEDGGRPLGTVAALLIGRVASADSLDAWLLLARSVTVRELREEVREARASDSTWPPGASLASGALADAGNDADTSHAAAPADDPGADPDACHVAAPADPGADPDARHVAALADPGADPDDEPADRALVRLAVPAAVRASFDEAVDLYRAVEGGEASVTSFVEALVAEAIASDQPPDLPDGADAMSAATLSALGARPGPGKVEAALARSTSRWRHLEDLSPAPAAVTLAERSLVRVEAVARVAGLGDAADLDRQMRAILALEGELEGRLGELLAGMGEKGAWGRLRFAGVGHYAEERLGMSRTCGEDRARAARALRRLPRLGASYESGRVGLEAALLVARLVGDGPVPAEVEAAWVERAEEATVKRLRDEARALGRRRWAPAHGAASPATPVAAAPAPATPAPAADPAVAPTANSAAALLPGAPVMPLDDAAWHASLRRAPGVARERVMRFGFAAVLGGASPETAFLPTPDVFLRLRLPGDLAASFLAAIEASRRALSDRVDHIPWDEPFPDTGAPPETDPPSATDPSPATDPPVETGPRPSVLAARMFSCRSRRVPSWVGLLALLEDFVATWDVADQRYRKRHGEEIYVRDGWRCMAPGCTSRRNLEDHHVVYRSRQGPDDLSNRACLCRFHHQRGEHGDLASCRGTAPLGILWRLGRKDLSSWYRNERSVMQGGDARSG